MRNEVIINQLIKSKILKNKITTASLLITVILYLDLFFLIYKLPVGGSLPLLILSRKKNKITTDYLISGTKCPPILPARGGPEVCLGLSFNCEPALLLLMWRVQGPLICKKRTTKAHSNPTCWVVTWPTWKVHWPMPGHWCECCGVIQSSAGWTGSWIIYCWLIWLVWYERKILFQLIIHDRIWSFTACRTGWLSALERTDLGPCCVHNTGTLHSLNHVQFLGKNPLCLLNFRKSLIFLSQF